MPQHPHQELAPVSPISITVSDPWSPRGWPVLVSSTWAQHRSLVTTMCLRIVKTSPLGWCQPDSSLSPSPHSCLFLPRSSLARTWSWCRPKKEDWLKKKDRYQRRPGCGRKKTRHCWVSSSSGPQRCRSARVGELLLRAQPWHLVPHHTVTTATVSSPLLLALRSPDGRGWVMLGSPNIAARVSRPTLHLPPSWPDVAEDW